MALSRRHSHNLTRKLPRHSRLLLLMSLVTAACAFSPQPSSYFTTRKSKHKPSKRGAPTISPQHCRTALRAVDKPAGAFFNPVPNDDNDNTNQNNSETETDDVNHAKANNNENVNDNTVNDLDTSLERLLKERNAPSLASQPSTINGVPTAQASGVGFGVSSKKGKQKGIITTTTTTKIIEKSSSTYIGIGPPDHNNNNITPQRPIINDVTQPEYDDQGYTLYANEETGEKSRVFEALVDYPCEFTMKIVGANEGTFVEEMLQVVADSCQVKDLATIRHKTRSMGKWMSLTVEAPVQNAKMLYELYENVDKDPRVKFKF